MPIFFRMEDDPTHTLHMIDIDNPQELLTDNLTALVETRLEWLYKKNERKLKAFNHLGRILYLLEVANDLSQVSSSATIRVYLNDFAALFYMNSVYQRLLPSPPSEFMDEFYYYFIEHTLMNPNTDLNTTFFGNYDGTLVEIPIREILNFTFPFYISGKLVQIPLKVFLNAYIHLISGEIGIFSNLMDPTFVDYARAYISEIVRRNGRLRALRSDMNSVIVNLKT